MKKIKLFFFVLLFLSFDGFCQNDSVIITKYNENYVEIQTLRFKLDSIYSIPDDTINGMISSLLVGKSFVPDPIILKDGIVLIKDKDHKPLDLLFYYDSVCIQDNYFSGDRLDYQEFEGDKNKISIAIRWNNENTFYGILYVFKKKKIMVVEYDDNRKPKITIVPW